MTGARHFHAETGIVGYGPDHADRDWTAFLPSDADSLAESNDDQNVSLVPDDWSPVAICGDCLIWHANGDASGFDDDAKRMAAVLDGCPDGFDVVLGSGLASDLGFSRSRCDLCDALAGDRHRAYLAPNTNTNKEG